MDIGALDYYILGEVITAVLSLLLCCNIFLSFSFFERSHRLFIYGSISTFLAAIFDIAAVYCITYHDIIPPAVGTTCSTLYFLFLVSVPFILASFAVDVSFSYKKGGTVGYSISGVVYALYLLIVLLNIKTGWIFRYDSNLGYVRGPLKYLTYILTAFYAVATVTVVVINRRSMAKRIFAVFMVYPVISLFFVLIQFLSPKTLLTGISSFSALFFAYITIQSDLIEFDVVTGLKTESKLKKIISSKSSEGYLYMLSIENMNNLQANMEVADLNKLLLNLGNQFSKYFERSAFHVSTNRFAGICKSKEILLDNAVKIEAYIKSLSESSGLDFSTTIDFYSAGIAFTKGETSYENLIELINGMLSKARNDGEKSLQICDETILAAMERKRSINKILKRELNLESSQFQVWYQPIYSLSEKKFTYMEALSRLNGTEMGNIPPQEFVEIAEKRGLIEKLGFVAFEKVCKFISDNRDCVQAVSINFSVFQMTNPNLVSHVFETISRFNLSPSNIIMEITESIFIENFDLVRSNMIRLSEAGIKFYLDDFGTGYSNLANVVALPFSTIKIDRSLVLMMEESPKGEHLFSNLISTFKDAGLNILVEGVETINQNYLVEKAGADYIQGFLYSRPLPSEKCIELLKKQK